MTALGDIVALLLIPLAPLLATVVILLLGSHAQKRSHWPLAAGAAVSLIAAVWHVARAASGAAVANEPLRLFRWIMLSEQPLLIDVGLRIDALSALLAGSSALVVLVVALTMRDTVGAQRGSRTFASIGFLHFCVAMVLLSSDWIELLVFWQLSAVAAVFLSTPIVPRAAGRVFLTNRLGEAALLLGILLWWGRFGTFDMSAAVSGFAAADVQAAITDSRRTGAELSAPGGFPVEALVACLLFAAVARCRLFPLPWREEESGSAWPVLSVALFLPVGMYLIARIGPLLAESADLRTAALGIGTLTALLAAAAAAGRSTLQGALRDVSAGVYGFVLLGLGTGSREGFAAGVFLLVVHQLISPSLSLTARGSRQHERDQKESSDRAEASGQSIRPGGTSSDRRARSSAAVIHGAAVLGAGVIGSGLWGQLAVLDSLWKLAADHVLFSLLYWSAALALLLTGFAIVRAFLLSRYVWKESEAEYSASEDAEAALGNSVRDAPRAMPNASARASRESAADPLPWLLPVLVLVLGPVVAGPTGWFTGFLSRGMSAFGETSGLSADGPAGPFLIDSGVLLILLGAVAAWTLYSRPSARAVDERLLADAPAPRVRRQGAAGRASFDGSDLLRGFWFLMVTVPLWGAAQFCRFVDWFLLDALLLEVPRRALRLAARAARPLENSTAQFYALAVVLAASLLLIVLTVLRT